ncbi:hypothetical protein KIN20_003759 [Parelaphostrongylus tenuis]|uniref:Uncharacterized protein n=1 Tax=Parelaphostrongylus tenuis TaxID=148309 RepID=A0AAD5M0Q9_PARTN|nr:hypothetical protein KIN20_003759 [Parelaphostrongylus tenuis]
MISQRCIIAGNTVTGICTAKMGMNRMCMPTVQQVTITPVPANLTSISGTLTTTNLIMATWSRMMWQDVVNRAVRMLALGSSRSNFLTALATVN